MSRFPFNYEDLPNLDSLQRYVNAGVPLGSFLEAVISNNLRRACEQADDQNIHLIPVYVAWLYNEAPGGCWGSPESYQKWIDLGGKQGRELRRKS